MGEQGISRWQQLQRNHLSVWICIHSKSSQTTEPEALITCQVLNPSGNNSLAIREGLRLGEDRSPAEIHNTFLVFRTHHLSEPIHEMSNRIRSRTIPPRERDDSQVSLSLRLNLSHEDNTLCSFFPSGTINNYYWVMVNPDHKELSSLSHANQRNNSNGQWSWACANDDTCMWIPQS